MVPNTKPGFMQNLKPLIGTMSVARVALVTSVWFTVRKPKLATQRIPLEQSVAIRVVVMEKQVGPGVEENPKWLCNNGSPVWVLRPNSIVAILDHEHFENETEGCVLTLTAQSLGVVSNSLGSVHEWWPEMETEVLESDKKKVLPSKFPGLFVQRRRAQKRAAKKAAQKKEKSQKKKKKSKPKLNTKKKSKKVKLIPPVLANFKRNRRGELLIMQMMEGCKVLDAEKFADSASFSADGLCRLSNVAACKNVPWSKFVQGAFPYFKAQYHGSITHTLVDKRLQDVPNVSQYVPNISNYIQSFSFISNFFDSV